LRTGIFALRAAPIQVNFLGYTGTMGTDYHDYIIADPVVIPPTHSAFYSEKIVYLKSFMPRRVQLLPCQKIINRISQLLPTEGFVFCCFNKTFKFNPVTFNSWLRILKAVPLSVLWFNGVSKSSAKNLIQYATDAGVDSSRLIFSDPVIDMPSHLARHRLANLFLDTYPYNAHTTASDALWSGLPVLTRVGNSFASRVSASLLQL
jgi:predicted O-linked N-acetylglucosamine transferase (SPINDLY family)